MKIDWSRPWTCGRIVFGYPREDGSVIGHRNYDGRGMVVGWDRWSDDAPSFFWPGM